MKCKICNTGKQEYAVDGVGVCKDCYEASKSCFICTCSTCNSFAYILRTENNIARIAHIMLLAEDKLDEVTLNVMIACIHIEKPTIIVQEACPACIKEMAQCA